MVLIAFEPLDASSTSGLVGEQDEGALAQGYAHMLVSEGLLEVLILPLLLGGARGCD